MFVDLVDSEDVLKAVRARGPIIPMEVKKFLGKGDSITIGAALSTLLSKNLIYSTSVKIGSSPFYYIRGQENKLELLNKYLNDKDKRVFELLREEKVLKDSSQEPLTRVSLRSISDFAKKIELSNNGEVVLFWRWYLLSEEDAIKLIRGEIQKKELSSSSTYSESSNSQAQQSNVYDQDAYKPHNQNALNNQINQTDVQPSNQFNNQNGVQNNNRIRRDDFTTSINQTHSFKKRDNNQHNSSNQENTQESSIKHVNKQEHVSSLNQNAHSKQDSSSFEQETIAENVPDFNDAFFKQLKSFFIKNNIIIKQANMIRKNSDYELIVKFNTPFGATNYFCKAKSKKKCNEGDLSSAYLQGQNKRMPTVFITTGEITKKAKAKIVDEYKGMLIKEL